MVAVTKSKAGDSEGRTKERSSCRPSRSNTLTLGMGAGEGRAAAQSTGLRETPTHSPSKNSLDPATAPDLMTN